MDARVFSLAAIKHSHLWLASLLFSFPLLLFWHFGSGVLAPAFYLPSKSAFSVLTLLPFFTIFPLDSLTHQSPFSLTLLLPFWFQRLLNSSLSADSSLLALHLLSSSWWISLADFSVLTASATAGRRSKNPA